MGPGFRALEKDSIEGAITHSNLGVLLAAQGRDVEAEQAYRLALAFDPENPITHSNLGVLLAKLKRGEEAERHYRRALELDPHNATVCTNLALLLEYDKREQEAERWHRLALEWAPECSEIHSNFADFLARQARTRQAEPHYRRALELNPNSAPAFSNLGVLLSDHGREQEAEQCFRNAIALDPSYQLAHLNLGILLLGIGRWREAWPYYEARQHPDLPGRVPIPLDLPFPRWQGEALLGKSVLVRAEQGLGDQIQFCRYVASIKASGARHVSLSCDQTLEALMHTLKGVDRVILSTVPIETLDRHDYWTFPLSIPFFLGLDSDAVPARIPYLRSLQERRAHWAARLPQGAVRVGLAWRGNANHSNDAYRSLPSLSALAPLWLVRGIHFVSLQKGAGEEEAANPPPGQALTNLGGSVQDFADTAAIVDQLDLIISVDTAVAHLAGALGKTCWVLLPHYKTDWRWGRQASDTPWYPAKMRLFRQACDEDWKTVVTRVATALSELASTESRP